MSDIPDLGVDQPLGELIVCPRAYKSYACVHRVTYDRVSEHAHAN